MMDQELEEKIKSEVPQDDSASIEEKMILHNAILELKPKVVLETGTHKGLATLYMLEAIRQNGEGHMWTADPFEWGAVGNFRKFPELEKLVTYEQVPGVNTSAEGIDFMFVDGYHEKVEVLAEIDALFPKLNPGAHVYFHDTNGSNISCDVPGALEERGLKVEYLKTLNGMAHYVHQAVSDKPVNKTKRTRSNVQDTPGADAS